MTPKHKLEKIKDELEDLLSCGIKTDEVVYISREITGNLSTIVYNLGKQSGVKTEEIKESEYSNVRIYEEKKLNSIGYPVAIAKEYFLHGKFPEEQDIVFSKAIIQEKGPAKKISIFFNNYIELPTKEQTDEWEQDAKRYGLQFSEDSKWTIEFRSDY